ncbi:hypothetical protein IAR55_003996 [Kwoniella newhampshirensis]|uniref:Uncharacterized protein n=1 Tax=Kwoniella newhampshirensis TaxID=1651941 RepID=A0AAW0YYM8_9TREE
MALPDAGVIAIVVASPFVLFSTLFLLAVYYRRRFSDHFPSSRETSSTLEGQTDLSGQGRNASSFIHDQAIHAIHPDSHPTHDVKQGDVPDKGDEGDGGGAMITFPVPIVQGRILVSQPHFSEKAISIRRLSLHPHKPDMIQRLNSVTSTLHEGPVSTQCQGTTVTTQDSISDLGPDPHIMSEDLREAAVLSGGGRQSSDLSAAIDPRNNPLAIMEPQSLTPSVIEVGNRRSSVLSGGMSTMGTRTDGAGRLSLRKVSAGGGEENVIVEAAGVHLTQQSSSSDIWSNLLPDPESLTSSRYVRGESNTSQGQERSRLSVDQSFPAHPYSSASLSRTSIIPSQSMTFPIPQVPTMQSPHSSRTLFTFKSIPRFKNRPDSLVLAQTSLTPIQRVEKLSIPSLSNSSSTDSNSGGMTTSPSTKGIKSPLLTTLRGEVDIDTCSDHAAGGSEASDDGYWDDYGDMAIEPTPGLFEAWRGFPPKIEKVAKGTIIQPHPSSRNDQVPHKQSAVSVSPGKANDHPSSGETQRQQYTPHVPHTPEDTVKNSNTIVAQPASRRTSGNITYLAEVVDNEKQLSSVLPHQAVSGERRRTIVSGRPPIISRLDLNPEFGSQEDDARSGSLGTGVAL